MKKLLLFATVIIGSILLYNYAKTDPVEVSQVKKAPVAAAPTIIQQRSERHYIFVPYWAFNRTIVTDSEHSLIYFGVGVNENGLDRQDQGFVKIRQFISLTPNADERILAIRMLDKNTNAQILKNRPVQEKIINDSILLAQQHNFDGILLDYETSAFGFESTTNNIASFFKLFSQEARSENLLFYTALYGDTYFQSRPFDVKKIGELSDKVLVMAYDFSKSRGNPGPNFPFVNNNEYGYDFQEMVSDFQKDVDNRKLVITLGYFGYDWRVNDRGESITNGVPLSTNEVEADFVENCEYDNCRLERRDDTGEPSIKYTDDDGYRHIVWFEDEVSAQKKIEFLKSKGILETAVWAYSYN